MATTSVTQPAGNGTGWTNSNNITALDAVYATASVPKSGSSASLIAYNFGFDIPSNATINGITISITGHASMANRIYISSASLGTWDNSTFTSKGSSKSNTTYWDISDAQYDVGSSSDLWEATWTYSDFNSSLFACKIILYNSSVLSCTAYIDYLTITVTYTISGTTYQLTASVPSFTTITPKISITKRIMSSIAGATSFSAVAKRFAGLKASINSVSAVSPFISIKKALTAAVQSSTSFISDLIIRGKQFLNAIISTSTTLVSNLKVNHTLASVLSGKTQISPFVSIKKALRGSFAGQTLFTGTIERTRQLISNITTQTVLTAKLIVPRLLSALISGKTTFTSNIRRLKNLASQVVGKTTFQAQLIRTKLLQAVITSTTQITASIRKVIKMLASFVGSTIFVARPTFWNKVKRYPATWHQENGEVKTWRRIK
jgi:hypothetical protein